MVIKYTLPSEPDFEPGSDFKFHDWLEVQPAKVKEEFEKAAKDDSVEYNGRNVPDYDLYETIMDSVPGLKDIPGYEGFSKKISMDNLDFTYGLTGFHNPKYLEFIGSVTAATEPEKCYADIDPNWTPPPRILSEAELAALNPFERDLTGDEDMEYVRGDNTQFYDWVLIQGLDDAFLTIEKSLKIKPDDIPGIYEVLHDVYPDSFTLEGQTYVGDVDELPSSPPQSDSGYEVDARQDLRAEWYAVDEEFRSLFTQTSGSVHPTIPSFIEYSLVTKVRFAKAYELQPNKLPIHEIQEVLNSLTQDLEGIRRTEELMGWEVTDTKLNYEIVLHSLINGDRKKAEEFILFTVYPLQEKIMGKMAEGGKRLHDGVKGYDDYLEKKQEAYEQHQLDTPYIFRGKHRVQTYKLSRAMEGLEKEQDQIEVVLDALDSEILTMQRSIALKRYELLIQSGDGSTLEEFLVNLGDYPPEVPAELKDEVKAARSRHADTLVQGSPEEALMRGQYDVAVDRAADAFNDSVAPFESTLWDLRVLWLATIHNQPLRRGQDPAIPTIPNLPPPDFYLPLSEEDRASFGGRRAMDQFHPKYAVQKDQEGYYVTLSEKDSYELKPIYLRFEQDSSGNFVVYEIDFEGTVLTEARFSPDDMRSLVERYTGDTSEEIWTDMMDGNYQPKEVLDVVLADKVLMTSATDERDMLVKTILSNPALTELRMLGNEILKVTGPLQKWVAAGQESLQTPTFIRDIKAKTAILKELYFGHKDTLETMVASADKSIDALLSLNVEEYELFISEDDLLALKDQIETIKTWLTGGDSALLEDFIEFIESPAFHANNFEEFSKRDLWVIAGAVIGAAAGAALCMTVVGGIAVAALGTTAATAWAGGFFMSTGGLFALSVASGGGSVLGMEAGKEASEYFHDTELDSHIDIYLKSERTNDDLEELIFNYATEWTMQTLMQFTIGILAREIGAALWPALLNHPNPTIQMYAKVCKEFAAQADDTFKRIISKNPAVKHFFERFGIEFGEETFQSGVEKWDEKAGFVIAVMMASSRVNFSSTLGDTMFSQFVDENGDATFNYNYDSTPGNDRKMLAHVQKYWKKAIDAGRDITIELQADGTIVTTVFIEETGQTAKHIHTPTRIPASMRIGMGDTHDTPMDMETYLRQQAGIVPLSEGVTKFHHEEEGNYRLLKGADPQAMVAHLNELGFSVYEENFGYEGLGRPYVKAMQGDNSICIYLEPDVGAEIKLPSKGQAAEVAPVTTETTEAAPTTSESTVFPDVQVQTFTDLTVAKKTMTDLARSEGKEYSLFKTENGYELIEGGPHESPTGIFADAATAVERRFFDVGFVAHAHPEKIEPLPTRDDIKLITSDSALREMDPSYTGKIDQSHTVIGFIDGKAVEINFHARLVDGKMEITWDSDTELSQDLASTMDERVAAVQTEVNEAIAANNVTALEEMASLMAAGKPAGTEFEQQTVSDFNSFLGDLTLSLNHPAVLSIKEGDLVHDFDQDGNPILGTIVNIDHDGMTITLTNRDGTEVKKDISHLFVLAINQQLHDLHWKLSDPESQIPASTRVEIAAQIVQAYAQVVEDYTGTTGTMPMEGVLRTAQASVDRLMAPLTNSNEAVFYRVAPLSEWVNPSKSNQTQWESGGFMLDKAVEHAEAGNVIVRTTFGNMMEMGEVAKYTGDTDALGGSVIEVDHRQIRGLIDGVEVYDTATQTWISGREFYEARFAEEHGTQGAEGVAVEGEIKAAPVAPTETGSGLSTVASDGRTAVDKDTAQTQEARERGQEYIEELARGEELPVILERQNREILETLNTYGLIYEVWLVQNDGVESNPVTISLLDIQLKDVERAMEGGKLNELGIERDSEGGFTLNVNGREVHLVPKYSAGEGPAPYGTPYPDAVAALESEETAVAEEVADFGPDADTQIYGFHAPVGVKPTRASTSSNAYFQYVAEIGEMTSLSAMMGHVEYTYAHFERQLELESESESGFRGEKDTSDAEMMLPMVAGEFAEVNAAYQGRLTWLRENLSSMDYHERVAAIEAVLDVDLSPPQIVDMEEFIEQNTPRLEALEARALEHLESRVAEMEAVVQARMNPATFASVEELNTAIKGTLVESAAITEFSSPNEAERYKKLYQLYNNELLRFTDEKGYNKAERNVLRLRKAILKRAEGLAVSMQRKSEFLIPISKTQRELDGITAYTENDVSKYDTLMTLYDEMYEDLAFEMNMDDVRPHFVRLYGTHTKLRAEYFARVERQRVVAQAVQVESVLADATLHHRLGDQVRGDRDTEFEVFFDPTPETGGYRYQSGDAGRMNLGGREGVTDDQGRLVVDERTSTAMQPNPNWIYVGHAQPPNFEFTMEPQTGDLVRFAQETDHNQLLIFHINPETEEVTWAIMYKQEDGTMEVKFSVESMNSDPEVRARFEAARAAALKALPTVQGLQASTAIPDGDVDRVRPSEDDDAQSAKARADGRVYIEELPRIDDDFEGTEVGDARGEQDLGMDAATVVEKPAYLEEIAALNSFEGLNAHIARESSSIYMKVPGLFDSQAEGSAVETKGPVTYQEYQDAVAAYHQQIETLEANGTIDGQQTEDLLGTLGMLEDAIRIKTPFSEQGEGGHDVVDEAVGVVGDGAQVMVGEQVSVFDDNYADERIELRAAPITQQPEGVILEEVVEDASSVKVLEQQLKPSKLYQEAYVEDFTVLTMWSALSRIHNAYEGVSRTYISPNSTVFDRRPISQDELVAFNDALDGFRSRLIHVGENEPSYAILIQDFESLVAEVNDPQNYVSDDSQSEATTEERQRPRNPFIRGVQLLGGRR